MAVPPWVPNIIERQKAESRVKLSNVQIPLTTVQNQRNFLYKSAKTDVTKSKPSVTKIWLNDYDGIRFEVRARCRT